MKRTSFFPIGILSVALGLLGATGALTPPATAGARGWSTIQNLTPMETTEKRDARDPSVYVGSDQTVHVVYREKGIHYLRSETNGRSWSVPSLASGKRLVNGAPSVLADEDGVHVVWPSLVIAPDHTNYQLFYVRSKDNGLSWSEPEQLTSLDSHSSEPRLLRFKGGIALLWYEVDEKALAFKDRLSPDILSKFFNNPLQGVVPREYQQSLRSTILVKRSTSGGMKWNDASLVAEVLRPLDLFFPYQVGENSFGVYWSENRKIRNKASLDGGLSWDFDWKYDQYLDPFVLNNLVYTQQEVQLIGIPRKPFEALRIRQFNVRTQQEEFLTQPVYFRSPPKAVFGGDEIHLVWSISDEQNTWLAYQRTDKTPPKTTVVAPTNPDIQAESFRIAWEGEDDISQNLTFSRLVAYGGTQWTLFEPGQFVVVQTPKDGEYVFKVRAKDEAGNIEPEPATIKFNTFGVPPNTVFQQPPAGQVFSRSVQVVWSGYDNTVKDPADLTYSYSLDGGSWSPFRKLRTQTFRGLAQGTHQLGVRAQDDRGNVDSTPAEVRFDVELGIGVAFKTPPSAALGQSRIKLTWAGSDKTEDNVPLFYSYRFDEDSWSEWSVGDTATLESLSEGGHLFEVRARDEFGNEGERHLRHEFFVDLTPPETAATLAEVIKENDYTPLLSLGGTDNLTQQLDLSFEYRIDDGPWTDAGKERSLALPPGLSPWAMGYIVEVRAKDSVGNGDGSPSLIDLTLPSRYFQFKLSQLGVAFYYPLILLLLLLVLLVGFIGGVLFLVRKKLRPKRAAIEAEVEEELPGAGEPGSFEEEDDLFGSSSDTMDETSISFDDDDDLFS